MGVRRAPDRSTLSRRVRGVLSPCRERGNSGAGAPEGGGIPAYAGMTVEVGGNDEKGALRYSSERRASAG